MAAWIGAGAAFLLTWHARAKTDTENRAQRHVNFPLAPRVAQMPETPKRDPLPQAPPFSIFSQGQGAPLIPNAPVTAGGAPAGGSSGGSPGSGGIGGGTLGKKGFLF